VANSLSGDLNMKVNKLILFSVVLLTTAVHADTLKTVQITASGRGETLGAANRNSYDKARFKAMAFEPVAVYSWFKTSNTATKSKVVQIPSQILAVKIIDSDVSVISKEKEPRKIQYVNGEPKGLGEDEYGISLTSSYKVENTFEFKIKHSQEVDRAKHLGEMQVLRDIISRNNIKSENTFVDEGYGAIQPELLILQKALLKDHRESIELDSLDSFEEISSEVAYFKHNMLAAIAKTYPDPKITYINKKDVVEEGSFILNIDLGPGCIMGDSMNPVGSLCDLWSQLPEQFQKTVEVNGLTNGNNVEPSRKHAWQRAKSFIESPLFYAGSIIDEDPFPFILFSRREQLTHEEFYIFPSTFKGPETNGGLQQIALPTSRSKHIAPMGHEMILDHLGVIKNGPDSRLLTGVTDAYSNVVLADFFASAIVGRPPVTLTLFNLKNNTYIDVPLTSDTFLLTSKLDITVTDNYDDIEYTIDDFELLVWWGDHPANDKWSKSRSTLTYPTLTRYSDSKAQLDILKYYRKNFDGLASMPPFIYSKVLPTSHGAFSSLMYRCLDLKYFMCKFNLPGLNKTAVIVGDDDTFRFADKTLNKLIKLDHRLSESSKDCWIFDPETLAMITCTERSERPSEWWLEIGSHPLALRKYSKRINLWNDLTVNTMPAMVLRRDNSRSVISGKMTVVPTIPATVW
jgi:hypothetical protein